MICAIPKEVLIQYHINPDIWTDSQENMYRTFLIQTDYIPAKIAEAQYLRIKLDEDYTAILAYRQMARDAINGIL
jgi:hypothetical protein